MEETLQAVLSLPAQAMTEKNLKFDQDCEARMTIEKESTTTILAMEVFRTSNCTPHQLWRRGRRNWCAVRRVPLYAMKLFSWPPSDCFQRLTLFPAPTLSFSLFESSCSVLGFGIKTSQQYICKSIPHNCLSMLANTT